MAVPWVVYDQSNFNGTGNGSGTASPADIDAITVSTRLSTGGGLPSAMAFVDTALGFWHTEPTLRAAIAAAGS
jgi:hypothetical protein